MKIQVEKLDERSRRILRELVSLYCATGEPVGSRTLSKKGRIPWSPATIRNVLSDLEEGGYIQQPHTSAGRVPTEKGYRFYVNHLIRNQELHDSQKELIHSKVRESPGSFQNILDLTTTILASMSHQIALAIAPDLHKMILENIEFVPVSGTRVLAILITRGGLVSNKLVDIADGVTHEELVRIANYIRSEFYGMSLPSIRKRLLDLMKQEQLQYDQMLKKAMILGQKTMEAVTLQGELIVTGASEVLSYPEFADSGRTRELLHALEEKSRILNILTQCIESDGVHILIGSENKSPDLKGMTMISSPYRYLDDPVGTVAILGPTRMDYVKLIPLVDHIAKVVSEVLTKES